MLDTNYLFASLWWGSIGVGYFIYGKKQQSISSMAGGILMIGLSYFAGSALVMSAASLAIVGAVYFLVKRDF